MMGKDILVLIVEDSKVEAEVLRRVLVAGGYEVMMANNGAEALDALKQRKPTIIISDVLMPKVSGYELCRTIKSNKNLSDIPLILLTVLSEPDDIINAIDAGADSYATKPFDKKLLLDRIQSLLVHPAKNIETTVGLERREEIMERRATEIDYNNKHYKLYANSQQILNLLLSVYENSVSQNRELIKTRVELQQLNEFLETKIQERTASLTKEVQQHLATQQTLRQTLEKNKRIFHQSIEAMANAIELRDPYTAGHQRRVTDLACAIAKELNMDESKMEGLRLAGLVHDVGKLVVPAEILTKPSLLAENEMSLVKIHAQAGYEILKGIEFPWPIAQIVLQHHERIDGSGYPNHLKGDDISLEAKILAVADTVEAMLLHRPYRPSLGREKTLEELAKDKGVTYDATVVDVCMRLLIQESYQFPK